MFFEQFCDRIRKLLFAFLFASHVIYGHSHKKIVKNFFKREIHPITAKIFSMLLITQDSWVKSSSSDSQLNPPPFKLKAEKCFLLQNSFTMQSRYTQRGGTDWFAGKKITTKQIKKKKQQKIPFVFWFVLILFFFQHSFASDPHNCCYCCFRYPKWSRKMKWLDMLLLLLL